jgi:hypothetical protein
MTDRAHACIASHPAAIGPLARQWCSGASLPPERPSIPAAIAPGARRRIQIASCYSSFLTILCILTFGYRAQGGVS